MSDRSELHIYIHTDSGSVGQKVDQVLAHVVSLKELIMAVDANTQKKIDDMLAAANEQTSIEQSLEVLLTGMGAQIASLKQGQTDPAVLAVLDQATAIVTANNQKTIAAITANTPAENPPA